MNFGLIKSGIQIITGYGAGLIADEALKRVKPKSITKLNRVAVKIGGYVLSAIVAEKASTFVGNAIDDTVEEFKKITQRPEDTGEETETEEVEES